MSVKTTMTFAIIATLFCAVIFATTETYYSTADGYMFQTLSPSSCDNIDGDNIKVGLQSSNDYYDGLICFTGITDVTVTSATLRLYVENITGTVASMELVEGLLQASVNLYRIAVGLVPTGPMRLVQ